MVAVAVVIQLAESQTAHEAVPDVETFRKLRDGAPVSEEPAPWEFPLLADCVGCRKPIRRMDSLFADWEHVD